MAERSEQIGELLTRVLAKYLENQKKPRRYGLKVLLYPSEILLLMLIGRYPEAGVTELAERGGVTKGAISQMVQKLENKRLIARVHDPSNRKRIAFRLTSQGYTAFYNHEKISDETDSELVAFLNSLTDAEADLITRFLHHLEAGINKSTEIESR